jgi:hypothetical protein
MVRIEIEKAVKMAAATGNLPSGLSVEEQLFVLQTAVRLIQLKMKRSSHDGSTSDTAGEADSLSTLQD